VYILLIHYRLTKTWRQPQGQFGNNEVENPLLIPYITKKIIKRIKIIPRKIIPIDNKAVLRKPIQMINERSNSNNNNNIVIMTH
jgi:hypothetical protein